MIKLLDAQIKDLQNFGVDKNNKFLIIAIDEFTDIINIERIGDKESLFIEAVDLLPSDDCRYLLLNYSDNNSTKVLFFKWIPDISKIKRKMMYSGFSNNIIEQRGNGLRSESYYKGSKNIKGIRVLGYDCNRAFI